MQSEFRAAMAKLAVIGQKTANMVDCSDVIPVPKPVTGKAHLPAGKSMADIEQAVSLVCRIEFQGWPNILSNTLILVRDRTVPYPHGGPW